MLVGLNEGRPMLFHVEAEAVGIPAHHTLGRKNEGARCRSARCVNLVARQFSVKPKKSSPPLRVVWMKETVKGKDSPGVVRM